MSDHTPPPSPTIGSLPLAHGVAHRVDRGAVERAVPKSDAARVEHGGFEVLDRLDRLLHRLQALVQRVVLGLHRPTDPRVRNAAAVALGDEPLDAGLLRRGEQVARTLRPEPVGLRERFGEALEVEVARQRGRLVDDRVRPGLEHHPTHGVPVEHVEQRRLGAERAQPLRPLAGSGRADNLVPALDELRHERHPDRSRCSDD